MCSMAYMTNETLVTNAYFCQQAVFLWYSNHFCFLNNLFVVLRGGFMLAPSTFFSWHKKTVWLVASQCKVLVFPFSHIIWTGFFWNSLVTDFLICKTVEFEYIFFHTNISWKIMATIMVQLDGQFWKISGSSLTKSNSSLSALSWAHCSVALDWIHHSPLSALLLKDYFYFSCFSDHFFSGFSSSYTAINICLPA